MMENALLDKLHVLTLNLSAAQRAEQTTRETRIAVEELIAELVPTKDVGQKTVTLKDGSKVTVRRSLNYQADLAAIEKELTGSEIPCPIKTSTKRELDIEGYEWLRKNHPNVFKQVAKHVSVTPRKVSVILHEFVPSRES